MSNKKVPDIRFKGFEDTWEQRKLKTLLAIPVTDGPHETPRLLSEGIPFLSVEAIHDGIIDIDKCRGYISVEDHERYCKKYRPQINDIFFTKAATIGRVAMFETADLLNIWSPIGAIRVDEEKAYIRYIYHFLQKPELLQQALLNSNNSSQFNLGMKQIEGFDINIPSKKEEQKRISEYFDNLDHLITLHQKKLKKLENMKKTMLNLMFPNHGQNNPVLRFNGFVDDWEQRKFGDLGSVAMCKRIFKEQTTGDGDIPFFKIGTFGGEPDAYISRELFEEYKEKFNYPEVGDMLISASGTIGRTVEYTGKDEYFQDSNIVWFRHDERVDNAYLKCVYSFVKWLGIEGSTIKRLYNDNFLKTEIFIASVDEQRKIGEYFGRLDTLITLHQKKLKKLENLKKTLLNSMFI